MEYTQHLEDVRRRQERVRPADTPRDVVHPLGDLTVPEYIDAWARQRPDRAAVVHDDVVIDYRALADRHARWAGWLRAKGVAPGDRVGVHLGNVPEFVVAFLGTLRAGCVHVPVNPMFQHAELVHELGDSGARVVVTSAALAERLCGAAVETEVRTVVVLGGEGDPLPSVDGVEVVRWSETVDAEPLSEPARDLDALAALNYTGGTTGLPKGCEHTQRHMVYTAVSGAGANGLVDDDIVSLCFIPVFWIAGEDLGILIPLVLGGTTVLLERWDAAAVVDLVERHRVTMTAATVENFLDILRVPGVEERDLTSFVAPMAMSFIQKLAPEIRRRWSDVIGEGSVLREGSYGMTESHTVDVVPYGFHLNDHDLLTEPVFCGLPVPGTDVIVVDPVTADPMPFGEAGEILLRSPSIMNGYWRNPEASAAQLRDGWLHTGDTGYLDDDGCLHYLARSKDLIKVRGMSVFPAEVEMILADHPDIGSVAVVPAEDSVTGQRPVAFVSARAGGSLSAEAVEEWARSRMASYKVPLVEVVESFPLTDTGKIRKLTLLTRAQELADTLD
ncbi:fatty-acyl-CoA synthase/long-chain acyl-CoA synthetase [Dietzia kunjamensis]|uniref:AMP-binding protein n=1 Tax=Dietzia kunjamensis TaxID=322509 RepID=UPI000E7426C8|nr:AMP-binding protein [Dietzia kunjamensis]MBB1011225.1 AMP-binding protein [Dietzia kunjamensis]RKE62628.1 fatty-acyl-CoA synthase/long-chain acyl-CoA synthetase [Dietzia kunjamensis]USX45827.1 AMP-binding protein [Dietzia kunjamensis]